MRKFIRRLAQRFGYDIVKYKPPFVRGKLDRDSVLVEHRWLQAYGFQSIIDIGANEGQFSDRMRILFPEAKIYAFEPLPGVCESLRKNFAGDSNFEAFNCGLGEQEGSIEFWENEYSPSSSFLRLSTAHKENFEHAVGEKRVEVSVRRLDQVLSGRILKGPLMVKIDVQGFEDKVIRGGEAVLSGAALIICELSFRELYKGQPLFASIYRQLTGLGFRFAGHLDQIASPETHEPLQADGIFIKEP